MDKITVTRGLSELKLLDSRINSTIDGFLAVDVVQGRNPNKVLVANTTKAEFEASSISKFESIMALMKRKYDIKTAIMASNSTTVVFIGGVERTVADAIEYRSIILYKNKLMVEMRNQLTMVKNKIEINRLDLEKKVDLMVTQSLGTDKKTDKEMYNQIAVPMFEANELRMIDPINIEKMIDKLTKEITDFTAEIDFTLSESNAKTLIEI